MKALSQTNTEVPGGVYLCQKDPKYAPPAIAYKKIGAAPSRYDPILRALNTSIDSGDALRKAEDAIEKRIERLEATISK